jgi:voltage-gated potassium channel
MSSLPAQVVIAGFGLPGRSLAETLRQRNIPFTVIELNSATVLRNQQSGLAIIQGDASDESALRQAGVERAQIVALMVPDEAVVLRAVEKARSLNSTAYIIARVAFTSSGLEAIRRGANESIVAEQVVARELTFVLTRLLGR